MRARERRANAARPPAPPRARRPDSDRYRTACAPPPWPDRRRQACARESARHVAAPLPSPGSCQCDAARCRCDAASRRPAPRPRRTLPRAGAALLRALRAPPGAAGGRPAQRRHSGAPQRCQDRPAAAICCRRTCASRASSYARSYMPRPEYARAMLIISREATTGCRSRSCAMRAAPFSTTCRAVTSGRVRPGFASSNRSFEEREDFLRGGALARGLVALVREPHSVERHETADRDRHSERRGSAPRMTPQELLRAIGHRVGARGDRQMRQVMLDVVGQLARRRVAPLRLLAHRHHDDGVEIAGERRRIRLGGSTSISQIARSSSSGVRFGN